MVRNILFMFCVSASFVFLGCSYKSKQGVKKELHSEKKRPNILWITCEDMSPRLGSYGDSVVSTPHIDKLASEGVRFTNVFSVSGVCAPSRAALITGMYPTSFGAMHMRTTSHTATINEITDSAILNRPLYEAVPPVGAVTYAELFRRAGYYTTNNAKTDYQFHNPISAWDECSNKAHWRNRTDANQPFFAVFNIGETHESKVWSNAHKPILVDTHKIAVPPYYPNTPTIKKDIAIHYSNIIRMDSMVGNILQQLEKDGLLNNTIIFFFSDHGDGLPRMKRWTYDAGLKVPLIVRFPNKQAAGTIDERLISFVDFAPTVLSLAQIEIPEYMQGQAFLGEKKAQKEREYIFAARDRMDTALDCIRTVRNKRYKYSKNYMPEKPYVQFMPYRDRMPLMQELLRLNSENKLNEVQKLWFRTTKPKEELFDVIADPHEINNLADDEKYASIKKQLSDTLEKWILFTKDPLTMPETELVKKLWPPDGIQPQTAKVIYDLSGGYIHLSSATKGASIVYQVNEQIGKEHWNLYTTQISQKNIDSIAVTAIRIGFKQSEISKYYF